MVAGFALGWSALAELAMDAAMVVPVDVDIVNDHRERNLPPRRGIVRRHLILRSSSAAAKNAEAVFRISFARRNSRTSRSSSPIRAASSLVRPGAVPTSISARLTHVRNPSGCTSNWPATRRIAAIRRPSAAIASNAIRVARSRSSSLYFFGAGMLCILPEIRACTEPAARQSMAVPFAAHNDLRGPQARNRRIEHVDLAFPLAAQPQQVDIAFDRRIGTGQERQYIRDAVLVLGGQAKVGHGNTIRAAMPDRLSISPARVLERGTQSPTTRRPRSICTGTCSSGGYG
jgi:hypothetical protein